MRLHLSEKSNKHFLSYLTKDTERTFNIERTLMGASTYYIGSKQFYLREKPSSRKFLNKIQSFQRRVYNSELSKWLEQKKFDDICKQTDRIRETILYKAFTFYPAEKTFAGIVKVDISSAYFQTPKIMKAIPEDCYEEMNKELAKENRLRMTGTLGRQIHVVPYNKGEKQPTYTKPETKKKAILRNIYERIKKFVDEIMVFAYMWNPDNFIGYYLDGFWLREYDEQLLEEIGKVYAFKTAIVDAILDQNLHGQYLFIETDLEKRARHFEQLKEGKVNNSVDKNDDYRTPYDVQFKRKQLDSYLYLHNLACLTDIDFFANINYNLT